MLSAFRETNPHNSLKTEGLKSCCTVIELLSNEALISVCCSSTKAWILVHNVSKVPRDDCSCLFNAE